jgi:hypothetical protein
MPGLWFGGNLQVWKDLDGETTFPVHDLQKAVHTGSEQDRRRNQTALLQVREDHACLHETRPDHKIQMLALPALPDVYQIGSSSKEGGE